MLGIGAVKFEFAQILAADQETEELNKIHWTHWDLNPGPSACKADVIPLHHEPAASRVRPFTQMQCSRSENTIDIPMPGLEPGSLG